MANKFKTKVPMFSVPVGTELTYNEVSKKYSLDGTQVWFFKDELLNTPDLFIEDTPVFIPIPFPALQKYSLLSGKPFLYYNIEHSEWTSGVFNPGNMWHVVYQSLGIAVQKTEGNEETMRNINIKIKEYIDAARHQIATGDVRTF